MARGLERATAARVAGGGGGGSSFAVADEQLLRWLEHPSVALRVAAATVLQERADRGHIERLLAFLAVPDAAPFAARALAVPGWVEAIPMLAELASAVNIKQTDVYTAGIAAIGGPAAAAALFRLARGEHPGHLLRTLSVEERSEVSAPHLEDPAPAIRVLALELLKDVTPLIERVRALLAVPDAAPNNRHRPTAFLRTIECRESAGRTLRDCSVADKPANRRASVEICHGS